MVLLAYNIPKKLTGFHEYKEIKLVLQNTVYDSLTMEDFKARWARMLTNYDLGRNDWLVGL